MSLCKAGEIQNCCHPNALLTLQEFLLDYASPETRAIGEKVIAEQLEADPTRQRPPEDRRVLAQMEHGERDFRF